MFSHEGFKEAKEARIVVENLQPENLEKILQYIYTDQVLALTLSLVFGIVENWNYREIDVRDR